MIAEVGLNVGNVVYHVRVPLRAREVAEVKAELMEKVGAAFDKSIADLKIKWKTRNRGKSNA